MTIVEGPKFPSPEEINFDKLINPKRPDVGLCAAVIKHCETGENLGVVFMSRDAYRKTIDTGRIWAWSREREELWDKGATSGNRQLVRNIKLDCDNDTVLIEVEPLGPFCHRGTMSCFDE